MSIGTILLVDDDSACRSQVACRLQELGHSVCEADSASTAQWHLNRREPDLMVLEWALPDSNGLDFFLRVKRDRELRVLMMSHRNADTDAARALDNGADDFIARPFDLSEMIARISACMRRPATVDDSVRLTAGAIVADTKSHRISVDGNALKLAPREYDLLTFLLAHQNVVYSRHELLTRVWERSTGVGERTVDVHMRRLRRLLEPHSLDGAIQTVRGAGYRFAVQ